MAGRLPGVGLLTRKRSSSSENNYHSRYHEHHHHASYIIRESLILEATPPRISVSALDETALKARQRLQKKLGQFFVSSSRESGNPKIEGGKLSESSLKKRDAGIGRKLLASSWLLRRNKYKKERKVCAVCLEDFEQEQKIMNLSCSHKYHSACLLPWLAAHPHCPCCRTPVQH